MITLHESSLTDTGIDSKHEVAQVCKACGYDLTAEELEAAVCADCGAPLEVAQNVSIYATTLPAASGLTIG